MRRACGSSPVADDDADAAGERGNAHRAADNTACRQSGTGGRSTTGSTAGPSTDCTRCTSAARRRACSARTAPISRAAAVRRPAAGSSGWDGDACPVPGPSRPDMLPPFSAPPMAAYPMFTGVAEGRSQLIRLRDLRSKALHLEGAVAEVGISFTTRQDDAFVAARMSLVFSYSNAVARDDGELQVFLNNEPIGSVALGKARGPKSRAEFTFTPALLSTDNRLQFRFALKGQGAKACTLDRDRAIWVNIEPATFVYLSTTRLPTADDLASLPRPFADPKDPLPLSLPFVLPSDPEPGVLQAAGMAAGYFGLIAGNKGASFPVQYTGLPAGNAVVLVAGGNYPGVAAIPGEGPRVAVVANPSQVDSKLLLIIGENAEQLQAAAATLATSPSRLSGGWSAANAPLPPPRQAYDAPKWIPSNRPVRLGELGDGGAINGRRLVDSPRVSFRTAPDLFFGALSGGKMYLHIRRADDSWIDPGNSRVFVDLNQRTVGEIPLEPKLKVLSRLKEWLLPGNAEDRVSQVLLPAFQLQSQNHLDFLFELRAKANTDCEMLDWSERTGIDPNSTIDLSPVAHFAAFPNLALFANAGFPFTRYADLATTAFVMPQASSAEEVQSFLNLLGMMADATGVSPTRYKVVDAAQVELGGRSGSHRHRAGFHPAAAQAMGVLQLGPHHADQRHGGARPQLPAASVPADRSARAVLSRRRPGTRQGQSRQALRLPFQLLVATRCGSAGGHGRRYPAGRPGRYEQPSRRPGDGRQGARRLLLPDRQQGRILHVRDQEIRRRAANLVANSMACRIF